MKIVKLFPKKNSFFHFGSNSIENSSLVFYSDSLASTLACNYYELTNGDVKNFLEELPSISSVFLGLKIDNKSIYFIPKPFNFRFLEKDLENNRKLPKKIKYISLDIYNKYLKNEKIDLSKCSVINEFLFSNNKDIKLNNFYSSIVNERNSVSREFNTKTEDSLYSIDAIKLNYDKNLKVFFYFFIDGLISEDLKSSIDLIKINGIGGDRSVGYGSIESINYEETNLINKIENNEYGISLSRFIVNREEINDIKTYSLVKISGFISNSSIKRNNIFAFDIGTVGKSYLKGEVVDLTSSSEELKCYRVLKPFFIKAGDN